MTTRTTVLVVANTAGKSNNIGIMPFTLRQFAESASNKPNVSVAVGLYLILAYLIIKISKRKVMVY
jgi:F0F1-type ATP synthase membrane subunit a